MKFCPLKAIGERECDDTCAWFYEGSEMCVVKMFVLESNNALYGIRNEMGSAHSCLHDIKTEIKGSQLDAGLERVVRSIDNVAEEMRQNRM